MFSRNAWDKIPRWQTTPPWQQRLLFSGTPVPRGSLLMPNGRGLHTIVSRSTRSPNDILPFIDSQPSLHACHHKSIGSIESTQRSVCSNRSVLILPNLRKEVGREGPEKPHHDGSSKRSLFVVQLAPFFIRVCSNVPVQNTAVS